MAVFVMVQFHVVVQILQSDQHSFRAAVEEADEIISMAGCTNLTTFYSEDRKALLVKGLVHFIVVSSVSDALKQ